MSRTMHNRMLILMYCLFSSLFSFGESQVTVRDRLASDTFRHSSAIRELFAEGDINLPTYILALDDPNSAVSDNAQYMIKILGNKAALERLEQWYKKHKGSMPIVIGPVSAPLSRWDFEQIKIDLLTQPFDRWSEDVTINYLFGLALDQNTESQLQLKELESRIPVDREKMLADILKQLKSGDFSRSVCCSVNHISQKVGKKFSFLAEKGLSKPYSAILSRTKNGEMLLISESQTFGYTFYVVLRRENKKCWKVQSISLSSVNN